MIDRARERGVRRVAAVAATQVTVPDQHPHVVGVGSAEQLRVEAWEKLVLSARGFKFSGWEGTQNTPCKLYEGE